MEEGRQRAGQRYRHTTRTVSKRELEDDFMSTSWRFGNLGHA